METQNIVIAHTLDSYAAGLSSEVEKLPCKVKITKNGVRTLRHIFRAKPDIVIMQEHFRDISAYEIIRETTRKKIDTKFIIIFPTPDYAHHIIARSLKLAGCVYEGETRHVISNCISKVLSGEVCFSKTLKKIKVADKTLDRICLLSDDEMSILSLVNVYDEITVIASKTDRSVEAVENHKSSIIAKLELEKKTYSLQDWAMKNNKVIKTLALQKIS